MRFLDALTGDFREEPNHDWVTYAILSHTWDAEGEQTYQDILRLQKSWLSTSGGSSVFLWTMTFLGHAFFQFLSCTLYLLHSCVENGHLSNSLLLRLSDGSRMAWATRILVCAKILEEVAIDLLRRSSYLHGTLVSRKIKEACAIALADGYRYIWIDSCCIDKSSSSELSEAINSMFNWYSNAAICYAYLVDVPDDDDPHVSDSGFSKSRWFRRGWTLQELVAPKIVVFFSSGWRVLGTKSTLASVIAKKTRIQPAILSLEEPLHTVSVAARMSWASRRTCTRVEDHAYSLLGIFDINMPTLYGEGSRAFMRLQEEIMKKIPDQSLFAWGGRAPRPTLRHLRSGTLCDQLIDPHEPGIRLSGIIQHNHRSFLAHNPAYFAHGSHYRHIPHATFLRRLGISNLSNTEYTPTPYGIRTKLPCVSLQAFPDILHQLRHWPKSYTEQWYLAILAVEVTGENIDGGLLARICFMDAPASVSAPIPLESGYCQGHAPPGVRGFIAYPLIALSSHALDLLRNEINVLTVIFCSEPGPSVAKGKVKNFSYQSGLPIPRLHCPASVRAALELAGFDVSFFFMKPGKKELGNAQYRITISDRSGYSKSFRAVFWGRLLSLEELSVTDGGVLHASARRTTLSKVFFLSSRRYEALQIRLPATGGKNRTLRLTVEHSSARPCHYLLNVDLLSDDTSPERSRSDVGTSECDGGGSAVHGDVNVALSGPAVGIDKDTSVEDGVDHSTVDV
ncbi:heterokaryon incompatibility protein-domain-containing protein [Fomes fomentarius]|nr:heterokaryon incompatibility protein-domain-containing protein [Fomes fomentarius]